MCICCDSMSGLNKEASLLDNNRFFAAFVTVAIAIALCCALIKTFKKRVSYIRLLIWFSARVSTKDFMQALLVFNKTFSIWAVIKNFNAHY